MLSRSNASNLRKQRGADCGLSTDGREKVGHGTDRSRSIVDVLDNDSMDLKAEDASPAFTSSPSALIFPPLTSSLFPRSFAPAFWYKSHAQCWTRVETPPLPLAVPFTGSSSLSLFLSLSFSVYICVAEILVIRFRETRKILYFVCVNHWKRWFFEEVIYVYDNVENCTNCAI